eukprot:2528779-Rhodomonas_salina.1
MAKSPVMGARCDCTRIPRPARGTPNPRTAHADSVEGSQLKCNWRVRQVPGTADGTLCSTSAWCRTNAITRSEKQTQTDSPCPSERVAGVRDI